MEIDVEKLASMFVPSDSRKLVKIVVCTTVGFAAKQVAEKVFDIVVKTKVSS